MTMPSILCGIDFTSACDEALRVAVEETKLRNGILDLIHVWYPIDPMTVDMLGVALPIYNAELPGELQQQLDQIELDLPTDRIRRHLESGSPADEIVRKAEALDSSLLVVGTHSRGPLMRWFVGGVAKDLLRMSPCPILVCRTPHPKTDPESPSDPPEGETSS
jgi:nucleotide-binding universal stress UspA family protein